MLAALWLAGSAWAQGVEGRVLDAETARPLPGVTVQVEPTNEGTATDREGRYVLRVAPGRYVLTARAVGFVEQQRRVLVEAGATARLDFRLALEVIELEQIEIVSERMQQQRDPLPSIAALEPEQARRAPGAAEDVLRALQAVPGVNAVSDFTAQFAVRGGGPDENLILLDGVEVFNPYRLYGVVSMFNPVVVSDIKLMTGGFPARYGDRLSSVLDVETRAGTTAARLAGSLNTSVANANAVLEGRTGWLNGSWLVTGRRTYYDLIVGLVARNLDAVEDNVRFPNFADLQGKLVLHPAKGHQVRAGGIASRDALNVAFEGADEDTRGSEADRLDADDLTRNHLVYTAWHWSPRPDLLSKVTLSWYLNAGGFDGAGQLVPRDVLEEGRLVAADDTLNTFAFSYDQQFRFRKWSLHQQTSWLRSRHFVEAGGGVDLLDTSLRYELTLNDVGRAYFESFQQENPLSPGAFPTAFDQGKRYYRFHAYAQDRLALFGERFFVQPGLRFDYYRIIDRGYVSPRLSFSFALDPLTTVRGAWGLYRQSPGLEKIIDTWQVYDLSNGAAIERLAAERTTHYVLGLTRWLDDRYQLRLETYFKTFDDLIVQQRGLTTRHATAFTGPGARTDPASYAIRGETVRGLTPIPVNDADGRAYGAEVLLEKKYLEAEDRLNGWIAYAYSHASRTRQNEDGERLRTPFAYDRRHVFDASLSYRLGAKWRLGATFRFGTGFPYTPALGYEPIVVLRPAEDGAGLPRPEVLTNAATGLARFQPVYGGEANVNSARLPDYHRLDLRLSRTLGFFGLEAEAYLDVINVYNRRNIFAYQDAIVVNPAAPERGPELVREETTMFPILPTLGFRFSF